MVRLRACCRGISGLGRLHIRDPCYSWRMTSAAVEPKRSDRLLYLVGVALSVPPIISLVQRQLALPVAPEIDQVIAGYRAMADGVSAVIHAPLKAIAMPPPPPLIDLHILSFAGMGMMTKALEAPGQKNDVWHGFVWSIAAFVLGYLLVGILVMGAILASFIANPIKAFHSNHWIETTPILEGPMGRLKRERAYKLERDLARIMAITVGVVGGYFALNWVLLNGA